MCTQGVLINFKCLNFLVTFNKLRVTSLLNGFCACFFRKAPALTVRFAFERGEDCEVSGPDWQVTPLAVTIRHHNETPLYRRTKVFSDSHPKGGLT